MENKKPDMRDQAKAKTSVADNNVQTPGAVDRIDTVILDSGMHELTPEIGKHLAEGQVTKSS